MNLINLFISHYRIGKIMSSLVFDKIMDRYRSSHTREGRCPAVIVTIRRLNEAFDFRQLWPNRSEMLGFSVSGGPSSGALTYENQTFVTFYF